MPLAGRPAPGTARDRPANPATCASPRCPDCRIAGIGEAGPVNVRLEENELGDRDGRAYPAFGRIDPGSDAGCRVVMPDADLGGDQQRLGTDVERPQVNDPFNLRTGLDGGHY